MTTSSSGLCSDNAPVVKLTPLGKRVEKSLALKHVNMFETAEQGM